MITLWILGLALWFIIAMWHLSRRHQIREKSTALYYVLVGIDVIGVVADVLANYTWFSVFLLDCPRFERREVTMSQHMARINHDNQRFPPKNIFDNWSRFWARAICRQLDRFDRGHCL